MIKFNGVDLQDVVPVKIEDISVPPIDVSPVANQRVGIGQDFVRMTGGKRTITITFALLNDDKDERFEQLEAIKEWASPWEEHALVLPMFPGKHFDCRCVKCPDPSYRQWWESKLKLVFETFENPYITSDEEITTNCGTPLVIGGTAPPMVRIERRLIVRESNQTYYCNGRSMFFSAIPAGRLVIDLNKQTAAISGTSIMQYFGKTSKFIEPVNGDMTITGNGQVVYRERWV
ncbi:MAG: hypothetical protein IJ896_00215 [Fibrobacter sp.]|nr:hypothetical protein [Fibrobacter sp.]